MRKKKNEKTPDCNAGDRVKKPIPRYRLDIYRGIIEKKSHNPDTMVSKCYTDMTDEELKEEVRNKQAIDRVALILIDFRLYLEMMGRGLLKEAFTNEED